MLFGSGIFCAIQRFVNALTGSFHLVTGGLCQHFFNIDQIRQLKAIYGRILNDYFA